MEPVELPVVVPPTGEQPQDIGTGHPMREVTEQVAADPSAWTPEMAGFVRMVFDEMAPGWGSEIATRSHEPLSDALERGGRLVEPVVELGAGTGSGTRLLAERSSHVVAGDLAPAMLARLDPSLASRVQLDASRLPFPDASVGTLVCVNMLLFAPEVRRVLHGGGRLVWVNSIGERTPIHLPPRRIAEALGAGFHVTASRAGWGTWAVARRAPGSE